MKYEIIVNMPVRPKSPQRDGALVHRIVCDHPATTVDALMLRAAEDGFIVVDEFYPDTDTRVYTNYGPIALNYTIIGKIKIWDGK